MRKSLRTHNAMTYLVDILSDVKGGGLDLVVDHLVYIADTLVHVVGRGLPALANIADDFLGLRLEWIRVAIFDHIDGLVGDTIRANDKRGKPDLDGLSEFVSTGRKPFGVEVGRAGICVGGQDVVDHTPRCRDHWDGRDACENGDFRCMGRLCFCDSC